MKLVHRRREGGSQSHRREGTREWRQSESVRAGGTRHSVGYGHGFERGSVNRDRSANTDSFSGRKRSRHDAFTNLPDTKKFRPSRGPSHDHPREEHFHGNHHRTSTYPSRDGYQKDNQCHGNYHKTRTYPSHKRDYRSSHDASDWSHPRKCDDREQSLRHLPQELMRVKSGHKRSHTHGGKMPSNWSQSKRNHHDDDTLESRLPMGGATSSSSNRSCEVVPYTSSEASCSSGCPGNNVLRKGAVSEVMSILGSNLVPSLPEKYYRCNGDGVSVAM